MKLSPALAVVGFCFNPINVQGFLLSNLAGRSLKHPVPQKGLYSRIEYDAREPRLDEFGLPLDPADLMEKPRVPLKDRVYHIIDLTNDWVDAVSRGRREEETRRIIQRRRAAAKAMAIKEKVLISLDYVFHPVKAWRTFVADPLEARHQRQLRQQAEKRARLERYLQRYNTVKNRFHDTLDLLESTTRTSVKVAKSVSSAVVGAPGTVTRTVKEVKSQAQGTAEAVAKVSSSVSSVVSKITSVIRKEDGALAGAKGKRDPRSEDEGKADPVKVREIWETKEQTAIRTIWEADELVTPVTPPATAMASTASVSEPQDENEAAISQGAAPSPSTSSPSTPEPVTRLSFRARVEADEKERFGSRRLKISGNVPPTASPTRGASPLPLDTLSSSVTQTFERPKVGPC